MPVTMLFSLKDVACTPDAPRREEPFSIKGKISLFGIPFLPPLWLMATITYPENLWEEIMPIIGAPRVREVVMVTGGTFEFLFPKGFLREGEYELEIGTYLGPTAALDSIVLPPAPSMASYEATFSVSGSPPSVTENTQNFRILGYGKGAGVMVTPNNPLQLNAGDTCRVYIGFNYKGAALSKDFYAALWQHTVLDPHDEVASAHKVFSIPVSTDWKAYQNYIDIPTSAVEAGDYGLYAKEYLALPRLISEYLPSGVVLIGGVPGVPPPGAPPPGEEPPPTDIGSLNRFAVARGTYNLGDSVDWTLPYAYKGKAQSGWLTLSLGTGVVPTFSAVHTFPRISVTFGVAMDWEERRLEGYITLPRTLERGRTYSARARLETADGIQETGTEYGAITISTEAAPPPEAPPPEITNLVIVNPTKSTWLGGIIHVTVMFDYVGPAITGQLDVAIGNSIAGVLFRKWDSGWVDVDIAAATSLATRLGSVDIDIDVDGGDPGIYDIKAWIYAPGEAQVDSDTYTNTITITE